MRFFGIMTIIFLAFAGIALALPSAEITASPLSGTAPLLVEFIATPQATITEYAWDFDDGDTAIAQAVNHTFNSAGTYEVTLTVTDNESNTATDTVNITVSAAPVGSSFSVSDTTLNFGGSNQERDTTLTKTVRITNTGASTLTNVGITEATSWDADYELTITPASVASLASGASADFQVAIHVPDDQDSGNQQIGILNAVATATNELTPQEIKVYLDTVSHLEITEVNYDIEGGGSDELDTDGSRDTIDDDVTIGDTVDIEVVVENTFDESIDIEDIDVRIRDADRELDFDDDRQTINRLRDGDDDSVTFTFTVDDDPDIDDGDTFSFEIEAKGRDENGAEHTDTFTVEVEITRENDEVVIKDVRLIPSSITCENSARLEVMIENTGTEDQERAAVEVEGVDFDLSERDTNINIDSGDDYTARFTIDTSDLSPGTYSIDIFSGYKLGRQDDEDFIDFTVYKCQTGEEEEPTTPTTPPDYNDFPTGDVVYGEPEETSEPNYVIIGLLALAVIVVIILIILLLVKATK